MIGRLFPVFLLIALLAACTAGGHLQATGPSSEMKANYDDVKLVFKTTATNSGDIVPDMRGAIVGQLLGTGKFKRVVGPNDPADLVLNFDITDYRRVGVAERVFIGVMAGPNRLTVKVMASDGKTGVVIRQFDATGESASHLLSGEAGYGDALREVAKQVALGLN